MGGSSGEDFQMIGFCVNCRSEGRMRIVPRALRAVTAVAAPLAKNAVPTAFGSWPGCAIWESLRPFMKTGLFLSTGLLCCLILSIATANATAPPDLVSDGIVSPQESAGHSFFRKQSSGFSLQVPIGSEKGGRTMQGSITNTANVQAWLLKNDGTAVPQLERPSVISIGGVADYSNDYLFFDFSKVPASELAGVVVNKNGKFYCHAIEMKGREPSVAPPDEDLVRILPMNISQYPLSVHVTNIDNAEHFTVVYKTDKTVFDKFLYAREELSDGDAVISSEPMAASWTASGAKFEFTTGYPWPFKFKIIEDGHSGTTAMPGYSGYWFYERDFATKASARTNAVQVYNDGDHEEIDLHIPGLNESISLTRQTRRYTVQLTIRSYPGAERLEPKEAELHWQAWLLRADGTAISQAQPPDRAGSGMGGWMTDYLIFKFPRRAGDDAIGVAVSIGGNLYCHSLK